MRQIIVKMQNARLCYMFFVSVVLGVFPTELLGQNIKKHQLYFRSDNDLYTSIYKDRYYSNGFFINYRWIGKADFLPSYAKKIWSFGIGHQIYLPFKSQIDSLSDVDRPFAAYMHANGSLRLLKDNETTHRIMVQVGIMGPHALGKEVQSLYHSSIGIFRPRGWQYQLKNELGVNIVYDNLKLLYNSKNRILDVGIPLQMRLGNTFSGVSIAALLRIGQPKPYHSSIYTGGNLACDYRDNKRFEYYFFIKPQLDYVAYDATIQGKLFGGRDPNAMPKNNFVYETTLGAAFSAKSWGASISAHFRSKDTQAQRKAHNYGSIGVEFRF